LQPTRLIVISPMKSQTSISSAVETTRDLSRLLRALLPSKPG
jgi:hypothetical protein